MAKRALCAVARSGIFKKRSHDRLKLLRRVSRLERDVERQRSKFLSLIAGDDRLYSRRFRSVCVLDHGMVPLFQLSVKGIAISLACGNSTFAELNDVGIPGLILVSWHQGHPCRDLECREQSRQRSSGCRVTCRKGFEIEREEGHF